MKTIQKKLLPLLTSFAVLSFFACVSVGQKHMTKGRDYFDRGLFEDAILEYKRAVDTDKALRKEAHRETLKAYNEIAMGLLQKKRYDDALRELNKGIKLDGWSGETRKTRSLSYAGYANKFIDDKNYFEAIKFFQRALALKSNLMIAKQGLVTAYNALAGLEISKNKFDNATKHLDSADMVIRGSGITKRNRALSLYKMGIHLLENKKTREAMQAFEKSKELDPKFSKLAENFLATAHNNRGVDLLKEGKFTDAISEFNSALVINQNINMAKENLATAHCNLGLNYLDKKLYTEASSEFNKALEVRPEFDKAIDGLSLLENNRGVSMLESGNIDEAIAFLEKAVRLTPRSESANHNLAIAHNRNGTKYSDNKDFESALVEFKLATKYKPNFGQAFGNMALAYGELMRFKDAWNAVNKAESFGFAVEFVRETLTDMEKK